MSAIPDSRAGQLAVAARDLVQPLHVDCSPDDAATAIEGPAAVFADIRLSTLKDVDEFVDELYTFWLYGGLESLISSMVGQLGALLFTQGLAWLLLFAINWRVLFGACRTADCNWTDVVRHGRPVSLLGLLWKGHVLLFQVAFVCFFLWSCREKFRRFQGALVIRRFIVQGLQIPNDQALQSLEWPELLTLVVRSQPSGSVRPLTAEEITHCLLRCDNLLIAWTEREHLTKRLPWWIPPRVLYCRHIMWNLRLAMFFHLFDSQRRLNPAYIDKPNVLNLRLRLLGLVNAVFLAPILCCSVLFSAFQYAEGLRQGGGNEALRRGFNAYSRWRLRCYNETEHHVRRRLAAATEVVGEYLQLRPLWNRTGLRSVAMSCALNVIQFAVSALLGVLFCLALIDERPLLHVSFLGRPLLWHSLLLGSLLTLSRLAEPLPFLTPRQSRSSPLSLCNQLLIASGRLHCRLVCLPTTWRALYASGEDAEPGKTETLPVSAASPLFVGPRHQRIQDEICQELFSPMSIQVVDNILGIVLSPFILGYVLMQGPNLQEGLKKNWVNSQRVGVVCGTAFTEDTERTKKSALLFELSHRCCAPIGPSSDRRKAAALEDEIGMFQRTTLESNSALRATLPADLQIPVEQLGDDAVAAAFFWLEELERPCVVQHLLTTQ